MIDLKLLSLLFLSITLLLLPFYLLHLLVNIFSVSQKLHFLSLFIILDESL